MAGSDYQVPSPSSVSFTLSGAVVETECINVTITDDDVLECDQDFTIEILDVTGAAVIAEPNTAVVTIVDDEGMLLVISAVCYNDHWLVKANV